MITTVPTAPYDWAHKLAIIVKQASRQSRQLQVLVSIAPYKKKDRGNNY